MSPGRKNEGERWQRRRRRAGVARVVIGLVVLALVSILASLQVFGTDRFEARARDNRLRPTRTAPPRGTIFDREGRILAHDVPGYDIALMSTGGGSIETDVEGLSQILDLDAAGVQNVLDRRRRDPGRPVAVVRNAAPWQVARLEENRFRFPEAVLTAYPKRDYPQGATAAHVVGYVGEISGAELRDRDRWRGYEAGRKVGKSGIERSGEVALGGSPGFRYLITDAQGEFRGWVPDSMAVPARPGTDLTLTLDLALQRDAAALFPADRAGAFVALDPSTGAVLALYSHPSFDPNRFVDGLDADSWSGLRNDPARPVMNRAIASVQPPASTWKPIVAALALDAGIVEPSDTMPIPCRGGLMYAGRYYRCWGIHGSRDLLGAIQVSCDVYFYQLGLKLGLDGYLDMLRAYPLPRPAGIDIPGERAGTFPSSRAWWEAELGYVPADGEVLSLAIGQGPQGVTPLRLAQLYTAFARSDGTAITPWLIDPPDSLAAPSPFQVAGSTARILREALRRVVGPGGTAAGSRLPAWDLRGKTGTAQNPSGTDHAWFAGFAGRPGHPADIVAVAFIEHGEHGSDAARYVSAVLDRFLTRRHPSYARAAKGGLK